MNNKWAESKRLDITEMRLRCREAAEYGELTQYLQPAASSEDLPASFQAALHNVRERLELCEERLQFGTVHQPREWLIGSHHPSVSNIHLGQNPLEI